MFTFVDAASTPLGVSKSERASISASATLNYSYDFSNQNGSRSGAKAYSPSVLVQANCSMSQTGHTFPPTWEINYDTTTHLPDYNKTKNKLCGTLWNIEPTLMWQKCIERFENWHWPGTRTWIMSVEKRYQSAKLKEQTRGDK